MYWCYKTVFGLVDIQPDDFLLLSPVTVRGHKYKLFKRGSKACVRAKFLLSVSLITGIVYLMVLILAVFTVLNVLFKVLILLTLDCNYIYLLNVGNC